MFNMASNTSSVDCTTDKQASNKDLLDEKKRLIKEINTLKKKVNLVKQSATTSGLSGSANTLSMDELNESSLKNVPNLDNQLQYELHRYAGFYCTKLKENEVIVQFNSSKKLNLKNTFAVQFFINDNNIKVAKWIMPMSINVNEVLLKRSISSLNDLQKFVNYCKYLLHCHFARLKQFKALEDITRDIQNCKVNSSLSGTEMIIEFLDVYDKTNDEYIDVALYLYYTSDRVEPNSINLEVSRSEQHQAEQITLLKPYVKLFKKLELQVAFEQFLKKEDALFTWDRKEESDFELDSSSSSTDQYKRKLSNKKKTQIQKKKFKKNEQKDKHDSVEQQKGDKDIIRKKRTGKKHLRQIKISEEREVNKSPTLENLNGNSTSYQNETPKNVKSKEKLKQTKLNFKNKLKQLFTSSTSSQKTTHITTSTPLRRSTKVPVPELSAISISKSISDIAQ